MLVFSCLILSACSDSQNQVSAQLAEAKPAVPVRVKLHIFSHEDVASRDMATLLIPSFNHLSYRYLFKAAHGGHVVSFELADESLLDSKLQTLLALQEVKSVKLDLVAPLPR